MPVMSTVTVGGSASTVERLRRAPGAVAERVGGLHAQRDLRAIGWRDAPVAGRHVPWARPAAVQRPGARSTRAAMCHRRASAPPPAPASRRTHRGRSRSPGSALAPPRPAATRSPAHPERQRPDGARPRTGPGRGRLRCGWRHRPARAPPPGACVGLGLIGDSPERARGLGAGQDIAQIHALCPAGAERRWRLARRARPVPSACRGCGS